MTTVSVVVFTRDLRIRDNPALAAAARAGLVLPVFVFDDAIIRRHGHNAARMAFLAEALDDLDASLRRLGGRLVIRQGPWARTVIQTAAHAGAHHIHLADDVSGYAARRLALLKSLAASARIQVTTHPGVTVAGPAGLSPASGGPYQVFTPYYRRWLASPRRALAPAPGKISQPNDLDPGQLPKPGASPAPRGGETAAQARLSTWAAERLAGYDQAKDDLAADATSRLSACLHFGCLSPLELESELSRQPGAARSSASSPGVTSSASCSPPAPRRRTATSATAATTGTMTPTASPPGRRARPASRSSTPRCASSPARASCLTGRA